MSRNSGIAFAHSDSPNEIKVVMNWGGDTADSAKCPTLLRYDDNMQVSHWGYNAKEETDTIGWFKLLLLQPEEEAFEFLRTSHELVAARQRMSELRKEPRDLVTDFLTKLLTEAKTRMRSDLSSQTVRNSQLRIVLTVPAMWPQYALETMRVAARDAIKLAGLDSCGEPDFVPEPEAAALATLKDNFRPERELLQVSSLSNMKPWSLMSQPGDCFVVCDAGGGTVVRSSLAKIFIVQNTHQGTGPHYLQGPYTGAIRYRRVCEGGR
jgi:molecular chaperone DnaK (HSP70)